MSDYVDPYEDAQTKPKPLTAEERAKIDALRPQRPRKPKRASEQPPVALVRDGLERDAQGRVVRTRSGLTRAEYVEAARANAFPEIPARVNADGTRDPGTPAAEFQKRAAAYAEWRWDAFHAGEVAAL